MPFSPQNLQAFKWSALGEAASRAIGPLVFLVLARLLVPEDFGVVAAATVVISFSQVFSDAGLAKALIQRQERIEDSANAMLWLNIALGSIIVVALLITAPWIAGFFHDMRITAVVRVLSLQVLLTALCATHTSLLQKNLGFRQLFRVRVLTATVPAIVSIPLALAGYGYWALVAGSLLGQASQAVLLWSTSDWRPHWGFDRPLAMELISFGKWATGSALLGWFFLWMDTIFVGHFLDMRQMGMYRVGNTFVGLALSLVAAPVLPVIYSLLVRHRGNQDDVRRDVLETGKFVVLLIFPLGTGMFLLREQVEALVFGPEWAGVGTVIGLIAITQLFAYSVSVKQEAYRAIGRPDLETKIMLVSMTIRMIFYAVSIQYGLTAFLVARLASTMLGIANHLVFARRFLGISFGDYLDMVRTPLAGSFAILMAGHFLLAYVMPDSSTALQLSVAVTLCVVIYCAIAFLLERRMLSALLTAGMNEPTSRIA